MGALIIPTLVMGKGPERLSALPWVTLWVSGGVGAEPRSPCPAVCVMLKVQGHTEGLVPGGKGAESYGRKQKGSWVMGGGPVCQPLTAGF